MKKCISFLLVFAMLFGMLPAVFADDTAAVTLSFADTVNRTSLTTDEQVWEENGITFTNSKHNSTNDVKDYSNPVRLYQGSSVTVAYPGMQQIDFYCNTTGYATACYNSIVADADSNVTATVNEKVVTVVLTNAVDTFAISEMTAQVRFDSIAVIGGETATEPEPEVPADTLVSELDFTAMAGSQDVATAVQTIKDAGAVDAGNLKLAGNSSVNKANPGGYAGEGWYIQKVSAPEGQILTSGKLDLGYWLATADPQGYIEVYASADGAEFSKIWECREGKGSSVNVDLFMSEDTIEIPVAADQTELYVKVVMAHWTSYEGAAVAYSNLSATAAEPTPPTPPAPPVEPDPEPAYPDIPVSTWWTTWSSGIEITTDGIVVTFNTKTAEGATGNWNGPVYFLYSAYAPNAAGTDGNGPWTPPEGYDADTYGYSEHWIQRGDNFGWHLDSVNNTSAYPDVLSGFGITYTNNSFAADADGDGDVWNDYRAALLAGVEGKITAKRTGDTVEVTMEVAGVSATVTAAVDAGKTAYLSLSVDSAEITNINVSALEPETPVDPEPETVIVSEGTDKAVTEYDEPISWTAPANGKLTVHMISGDPAWYFMITGLTLGVQDTEEATFEYDVVGGETYDIYVGAYSFTSWANCEGVVSYKITFTPGELGEEEKVDYEVDYNTLLTLGENTVTPLSNALTTIYEFTPAETGVYTITAPEGVLLSYWGGNSAFVWDLTEGEKTNVLTQSVTSVGQSVMVGVTYTGTDPIVLNIVKTDDIEVKPEIEVETYTNTHTPETYTLPEGATVGDYVDVSEEHTAVLGEDGYYHLDSADGPILLVDLDYLRPLDWILSQTDAINKVVHAVVLEDGEVVAKYDILDAYNAYAAAADENGYYPLTADLMLFYQGYAINVMAWHYDTSLFPEDMVVNSNTAWMYACLTMELAKEEEPAQGNTYVLDTSLDLEALAASADNEGQTIVVHDYFTITLGSKTKIDASNKTFDDGYAGTQRFNFQHKTKTDTWIPSIKFTTSAAATVKIWWISAGDGRTMAIYDAEGNIVAATLEEDSVKDGKYITEFALEAAGTYYLGTPVNSNYLFKLEVAEEAASETPDENIFVDGDNYMELKPDAMDVTYTYTATQTGKLYFCATWFGWDSGNTGDYSDNTEYMDEWNMYTVLSVNGVAMDNYYGSVDVEEGKTYTFVWSYSSEWAMGLGWAWDATLNLSYTDELIPVPGLSEDMPIELWFEDVPTTSIEIPAGGMAYYNLMDFDGAVITVTGENAYVLYSGWDMESFMPVDIRYDAVDGVVTLPAPNGMICIGNAGDAPATFEIDAYYPAGSWQNPAAAEDGDNAHHFEEGDTGEFHYEWIADCDGTVSVTITDKNWMFGWTNYGSDKEDWSDDVYGETIFASSAESNKVEITVSKGDIIGMWIAVEGTYDEETGDYVSPATTVTLNVAAAYTHKYGEGVHHDATCGVDAYTEYTCELCGHVHKEVEEGTALEHNFVDGQCEHCGAYDFILGDVNGDGKINLKDVNMIVSYYNGNSELTEDQIKAADVNGDGKINLKDVNLIVSYYNGNIDSFDDAN